MSGPDAYSFYFQASMFLAYITFVMSIEVTTSLISMRENGFLKMFKFVSGNKYPMIFGKIITQLSFLTLSILLFSLVISLFSLSNTADIILFIVCSLVTSLCGAIPAMFFFLVLMIFPMKQESLVTILNMLLLVFLLVTANNLAHSMSWGIILLYINPLELVRALNLLITEFITGEQYDNFSMAYILFGLILYIIIGFFGMRYMRIVSSTNRT
ncbi:hypothetical protein LQV63_03100 [Paenibacillus profundus]|uniref:ABC-2 type transporter domain-containing protein n=2 Tax=Paenibacillus profundus TaxID=1173085 RepID=A0ABS8Y916_9BACL|nr:hypothetical protein [Paenibacillus profundus]